MKTYTKNWKNCSIIDQNNKGSANATNVGIKKAQNKYIKFLDADDVLLENSTLTLLKILEKNRDAVLVYGLQRKIKDISKVKLEGKISSSYKIINKPIDLAMRNSMFNPSQFLVRTEYM